MEELKRAWVDQVNCRVGSLEKEGVKEPVASNVNCRVGSLENYENRYV